MLYRYTRLDWFWQRNFKHLPISGQSNQLAQEISSGRISGADILGYVGSVNRPGWCTNDTSCAVSTDANRIRDQIGLKHIEGDWLLELAFPFSFFQSQNIDLQAPTVIDSVAGGAESDFQQASRSRRPGLGDNRRYEERREVCTGDRGGGAQAIQRRAAARSFDTIKSSR